MLSNRVFWYGVIVGVGGVYIYHRTKGLPPKKA